MFKLNKDVEYALIGLSALEQGRVVPVRDIADKYRIPFEKLSKIFQKLCRVGIVKAHYGVNGGYEPQTMPDKISVFDIVHALHGQISVVPCIKKPENCDRTSDCTIRGGITRLQSHLEHSLRSLTLMKLLQ